MREMTTMRSSFFHRARRAGAASIMALTVGHGPAIAADLTIALQTDVTSFDPHVAPAFTSSALHQHVFDSLVVLDRSFVPQPNLAIAWRTIDELTWEFDLRPDVRFSDGAALTADDVAFSIRRINAVKHPSGTYAPYTRAIKEAAVTGPLRLRLITVSPYPALLQDLARVRVVPARLGDDIPTEAFNTGRAAIGSGPYRLGGWTPGEKLEFVRNPNYWGSAPSWNAVTFRPIPSDAARLAALLSDSVQVIDKVAVADVAQLRNDNRVSLFVHDGNRTMFLVPDAVRDETPYVTDRTNQPIKPNPLKDLRVRQAISLGIQRQALVDRVMEGLAAPANQAAPQGMLGYAASLPPASYDPARARALLAEAGFPEGFRLTLHCSNGRYVNDRASCLAAAQMLTRIGIEAAVDAEPQNVFYARMTRFDASLLLNGWGSYGDNFAVLRQALHSVDPRRGYGGFNRGRYSNPEVDRQIEIAAEAIDPLRREEALQAAMSGAIRDLAIIPLYTASWAWATRKGLAYAAGFDEGTLAANVTLAP
jgi:peptide/nickel transport system substrate-binding protein